MKNKRNKYAHSIKKEKKMYLEAVFKYLCLYFLASSYEPIDFS